MKITNILIIDDFLKEIDKYVKTVLKNEFKDYHTGENQIFKNIQISNNLVFNELIYLFPNIKSNFDFIRKSPINQKEPNMIHSDSVMGELTCLLYLNKKHPKDAGTKFYENIKTKSITSKDDSFDGKFKESIFVRMKYNRMVIFPSNLYHSRSIFNNFGKEKDSRLVQVLFLNQ